MTAEGLDKYLPENNSFKHYKFENDTTTNLSGYNNFAIFEDSFGKLWVGTKDGLNYFDTNTEKFLSFKHSSENDNAPEENRRNLCKMRFSHNTILLLYTKQDEKPNYNTLARI